MKQDKARLGEAIRKAREAMSPPLTQEQLAEAVHIGLRRMGDIERGNWQGIRPANRDAIEAVLGWEHGSWDRVLAGGQPIKAERQPVQRRKADDGTDDLVYVVTKAGALSPEKLHTLRLIIEAEIERSNNG